MFKFRPNEPRIYVQGDLKITDFFSKLNVAGVRYVLLRWWQNFPDLPLGEDLDILVHKDDYSLVEPLLTSRKTKRRCDVYFHLGPGGNRRKKLPYFPPKLARETLEERILYSECVYIPSPRHYLASLVFHALFHKGFKSGIPGFMSVKSVNPEHDYCYEISNAAKVAKINNFSITAKSLYAWLQSEGYAPPIDMLGKLAQKHVELTMFANLPAPAQLMTEGELLVFVVRRIAGESQRFLPRFVKMLEENVGIEVLAIRQLHEHEVGKVSEMRGNKWDKGPYWISAGRPHTFVTCYDWYPDVNGDKPSPLLLNQNIARLKTNARSMFNKRRLPWFRCNPVHSPDNELEAYEYLEKVDAGLVEKMKMESGLRKSRFTPKYSLVKTISKGRRSRTDLIEYRGELAIQKTFRVGLERYCLREIEARRLFSDRVEMPRILDSNDGYVIMEYVNNQKPMKLKSISFQHKLLAAKNIVRWVHAFWERGYFHACISTGNILMSNDGKMTFIDHEFLQPYRAAKPQFRRAYEFEGLPSEVVDYDRPVGPLKFLKNDNWRLLPFEQFIAPLIKGAEEIRGPSMKG